MYSAPEVLERTMLQKMEKDFYCPFLEASTWLENTSSSKWPGKLTQDLLSSL